MGQDDDTFETLALALCNTDEVDGLSWAEVEQCEVREKNIPNHFTLFFYNYEHPKKGNF